MNWNFRILGLVGLFSIIFVSAVIWKMDSLVVSDRSGWAQAQMRTQVSSLQLAAELTIKNIYRSGVLFQTGNRDKNFWNAMDPFKAMGWIRDIKNPTLENISIREGTGLDDTSLAMAMREIQSKNNARQKLLFIPWQDSQRRAWVMVVWPWQENRNLVLWAGAELLQAALESHRGSLSQLMIVNEDGQVLAHRQSEYFATKLTDHPLFRLFKTDGVLQGELDYQDSSEQKFLGHLGSVANSNLVILASSSQQALLADRNKISVIFLFMGLGLVLVTLAALSFMSRPLTFAKGLIKTPGPKTPPVTEPVGNVGNEDKQKAYRKIASSLSHELQGPLARTLGFCQMILAKDSHTEIKNHVDSILREIRSARGVLEKLFNFAQEKEFSTSKHKISDLIKNVVARVSPTLERKNIKLIQDVSAEIEFLLAAPLFEKTLEDIIQNSIEALDRKEKKEIKIELKQIAKKIEMVIEDNGEGIEVNQVSKVFDPFYTTKSYANHLGLGLSAAYGIIHQHGGEIKVESRRGQGTKVLISFSTEGEMINSSSPPLVEAPTNHDVLSFSPADVEIEKLIDLAESEFPVSVAPAPVEVLPKVEEKGTVSALLDEAHFIIEKPKSNLDEFKFEIRRPKKVPNERLD